MNLQQVFYYIVITLIFMVIFSLWGFYSAIRPWRIISTITPAQLGLKYENVAFSTADDVIIRGWYIPNENPKAKAIILLHGYPADKGDILPSRIFLHKNYNLLFIDFRFLGQSSGNYSTAGKDEVLDLLGAIEFLKTRGINAVGVWGLSLGGAVALMAAERSPAIKAIVAESSYARLDLLAIDYFRIPLFQYPLGELMRVWGMLFLRADLKTVSPAKSAAHLQIPILLMHSRSDSVIPFTHAELLQKASQSNPNVKYLFSDNLWHGELPQNHQIEIENFFHAALSS